MRNAWAGVLGLWVGLGALAGCAADKPSAIGQVPEVRPGMLAGYLPRASLPDSLALLPPPPAAGSADLALDEAVRGAAVSGREATRFALARDDADLTFPHAAQTFSCALGVTVTAQQSPYLYLMLRRSLVDAGLATYRAKDHYQRKRPFVVHGDSLCTPQEAAGLERDGSYPSGHSAIGWAWALILAELAPERSDAILARGLAFGRSRSVCNVHWASDIRAGQLIGAATVARLHADPTFRADLRLASDELRGLRATGTGPATDCAAQEALLGKP